MSLPLATADKIAAKIFAELAPLCERIEIAGSIRRRRPNVNDIDLVVIPKHLPALRERVARNCRITTDGEQTIVAELPRPALASNPSPLQLDIWIARREEKDLLETKPTNFGSLLLCRTGSVQHNIFMLNQAERLGLRWNPYHGVFDSRGKCLACATEDEIFKVLKMDFVPPERRER